MFAKPITSLVSRSALIVSLVICCDYSFAKCATLQDIVSQAEARNSKLLRLKANLWLKLHDPAFFSGNVFTRQGHAGAAYDSKRGTILIFGSDTHGQNWDNQVHEFDPVQEKWTTHYPLAGKETYRADAKGRATAGKDRLLPWAMHTYDTVTYDPLLDALIVSATPDHNPMMGAVSGVKIHPTWIYLIASRQWRIFENNGKPYPNLFAAATVYDPVRQAIIGYHGGGVWEVGPERDEWKLADRVSHHGIHHNMEYDSINKKFAVFGEYRNMNDIWLYTPGVSPGLAGSWEKRIPKGDIPPKSQSFPVAFDDARGIFLMVVDNPQSSTNQPTKARSSSTFTYDPKTNTSSRLPLGDMPHLGMNYMMVFDKKHSVFLLVTGDWQTPTTVWALRLP